MSSHRSLSSAQKDKKLNHLIESVSQKLNFVRYQSFSRRKKSSTPKSRKKLKHSSSTVFFKKVTFFGWFLHHSTRNELLKMNLLITNQNSCENSKLKIFLVFRLSAVYISFPPARLLFYSFTSEKLILIKIVEISGSAQNAPLKL